MLIDFLSKSCNTHIKENKMLIGFWVVHAILTHGHKICIQDGKEKKKLEKQEEGK